MNKLSAKKVLSTPWAMSLLLLVVSSSATAREDATSTSCCSLFSIAVLKNTTKLRYRPLHSFGREKKVLAQMLRQHKLSLGCCHTQIIRSLFLCTKNMHGHAKLSTK
uniref:Secreted protein n=1 Tax=Zea mays TaxID=4577 RepID=B8A0Z5_MAIZE|nr:unknown [Zea mays]